MGDQFDSSILNQIKEQHIKPRAKWIFILKDVSIWSLGILSLFLGAIAVSIIIYFIKNSDWDLYDEMSGSLLEYLLLAMPYFWLIFLAVFIFVVNYDLKHTRSGYRVSLLFVFSSSVFASVFLGVIFYNVGMGQALDDVLGENVAFYDRVINPMMGMWNQPERGRLAGLVEAKINDGQYQLIDMGRQEWLIDISNAKLPMDFEVEIGRPVRLLGKIDGVNFFTVTRLLSHDGPGRGMVNARLKEGIIPCGKLVPPPGMTALDNLPNLDQIMQHRIERFKELKTKMGCDIEMRTEMIEQMVR